MSEAKKNAWGASAETLKVGDRIRAFHNAGDDHEFLPCVVLKIDRDQQGIYWILAKVDTEHHLAQVQHGDVVHDRILTVHEDRFDYG